MKENLATTIILRDETEPRSLKNFTVPVRVPFVLMPQPHAPAADPPARPQSKSEPADSDCAAPQPHAVQAHPSCQNLSAQQPAHSDPICEPPWSFQNTPSV
jgi:hypothetical protein